MHRHVEFIRHERRHSYLMMKYFCENPDKEWQWNDLSFNIHSPEFFIEYPELPWNISNILHVYRGSLCIKKNNSEMKKYVEKFIDNYVNLDKLTEKDWKSCSYYVSTKFMIKHIDKIKINTQSVIANISFKLLDKYSEDIDLVNWIYLSRRIDMPKWFFYKYINKLEFDTLSNNIPLNIIQKHQELPWNDNIVKSRIEKENSLKYNRIKIIKGTCDDDEPIYIPQELNSVYNLKNNNVLYPKYYNDRTTFEISTQNFKCYQYIEIYRTLKNEIRMTRYAKYWLHCGLVEDLKIKRLYVGHKFL